MKAQSAPFVSVFSTHYDCVVLGGGLVGWSAATSLVQSGKRVLLVEPSGDLLFEITRALETETACVEEDRAWQAWLEPHHMRGGLRQGQIDGALAEVLAAHQLYAGEAGFSALLYAHPVALARRGEEVVGMRLATKSGYRDIQASTWLDATEAGLLAQLCPGVNLKPRQAVLWRKMVLATTDVQALAAPLQELLQEFPEVVWEQNQPAKQVVLKWPESLGPWHEFSVTLVGRLRALLEAYPSADFCLSHVAMASLPVYEGDAVPVPQVPSNVVLAVPGAAGTLVNSLAERYKLGQECGELLAGLALTPAEAAPEFPQEYAIRELYAGYEVIVAGTGTAGAIAALTSGRQGARTLALDLSPYPGGVGTGGAINNYFHGVPGGVQDEVDERTRRLSELFTGASHTLGRWHHEAKKVVLLQMMAESGVTFLGNSFLCGVEMASPGEVQAVQAVVEGCLQRLAARAFIDSSGDGDLCVLAGARAVTGRPGDGRTLAYSQSCFSWQQSSRGMAVRTSNYDAGWVDATDAEDLTRARLEGLAQYLRPQWDAEDRPVTMAPTLGLRHSRLIETESTVTMDHLISHTRFEDAVGVVQGVADTHSVDFEFESDDMAFYYWVCRCFRLSLACDLPYGMLLPRDLDNVWIACRASGMQVEASYGVRMQREMQRLGEAAGIAAALSEPGERATAARVQQVLATGSGQVLEAKRTLEQSGADLLALLDAGRPGVHLWQLSRQPALYEAAVLKRLHSAEPRTSFYAAAILALWGTGAAQPRLLLAISNREKGPDPGEFPDPGAHGQCITLPFWLQAVLLLRSCGDGACLPALCEVASTPDLPFNVKTLLACTLERLAARVEETTLLQQAVDLLDQSPCNGHLAPSRSLWREIYGEAQVTPPNERGGRTEQDHRWQLDLVLERTRFLLDMEPGERLEQHIRDPRGFVRRQFAG